MAGKTHVLIDDSLGGVEREYAEDERKAEEGDWVYLIHAEAYVIYYGEYVGDYITLVPTDVIVLIDERYRMVNRKAVVGERVLITEKDMIGEDHSGNTVMVIKDNGVLVDTDGYWNDGSELNLTSDEYTVLEPLNDESTAPRDLDEIIANLARRVSELERALSDIRQNVETWAQEVEKEKAFVRGKFDTLGDLLRIDGKWLSGLNDKVERCVDDIVMLDERTRERAQRGCCRCR